VTDERPDPDALLEQLRAEEEKAARGRLRIYFGSSAGVGKTYAMLLAARKLKAEGRQLLVGVVETHGRSETAALTEGLELLPARQVEYRGRALPEFDLDGALARLKPLVGAEGQPRPLILVDELAHSNVAGSRHPKRWQDVEELLANGIDVYTSLNVQHLESLNDVVGGITGVRVQETLPDRFFDAADEVLLVDTPADELLTRLKAGKVYRGPQAERAAQHFFRKGNLMALRELALRRTADRVEDDVQAWRSNEAIAQVWSTEAAILCAVGPTPRAEHVLRSSARLAQQLGVSWHAVYVETPALQRLPDAQRERVLRQMRLAQDLGAATAVLQAQDAAVALSAHAREHNLSKLVLGRSPALPGWRRPFAGRPLYERLATRLPDVDLIEVGLPPAVGPRSEPEPAPPAWGSVARQVPQYALAATACGLTAALAWPLRPLLDEANIVMLFLLTVLGVSLKLGRGPAVLASFLSVGLFDYFYVAPHLSFAVSDVQYLLTFGVMLAVGLIVGQLTAHLRYQAQVAAEREARSRALFELTRELAGALQTEQVAQIAQERLARELHGRAQILVLGLDEQLHAPLPLPVSSPGEGNDVPDAGTARWALDHGQAAGLATDTLPGSPWFYLPLAAPMRARGVLCLRPRDLESVLRPERRAQLDTMASIVGQALERVHYVEVAQNALVHIESERLRNSLLSALSHDLRTPLAVVYGLADTLAALPGLPPQGLELAGSLRQESQRINAMVSNLLDMARLQSGAVRLRRDWLPIDEVLGGALQAMHSVLVGHRVQTRLAPGLPLVEIDAALIERVLANLLENAAKYTPPGSRIEIAAQVDGADLRLTVADDGPGLPAGREEALFEKFTRAKSESSIPGVGLGLAICRAILEAHGGRIWAERAALGGAAFVLTLPLGQPPALPREDEDEDIEGAARA
jgi:two-component system sensor histidine kinase KdpD